MKNLDKFKKVLEKSLIMDSKDKDLFNKIPDEVYGKIFSHNFNGDVKLAERIILNDFDKVDEIDIPRLDKEKSKIVNLDKATKLFNSFIDSKDKIVFITDNDNDGSLSQAAIIEFLKLVDIEDKEHIEVLYSQPLNGNTNRGFTVDLVDLYVLKNNINKKDKFLIVTADNGINSEDEKSKIQIKYPNANILITDHHMPDKLSVIKENSKTVIFNPKYKPTAFYKKKNISGANTVAILLENIIKTKYPELYNENPVELVNMKEISQVANLVDYVDTDVADKPLRNYIIEKANKTSTLLNVNNSLNKIITGEISSEFLDSLGLNITGLDKEKIKENVENIKRQNIMASKLLSMNNKYTGSTTLKKAAFYDLLAVELEMDEDFSGINPNYIEQLRPLIFNYSFIDNKNSFHNELNEVMLKVFEEIRKSERGLFEEIRKGKIMNAEKLDNSTILYPVDSNITKYFNRKFLGKAYNEENNGFLLILDSIEKTKVSGSFRSLYRIQEILVGKEVIEKAFKIKIDFMGHDNAAGFFINSSNDKEITPKVITAVNNFISDSIERIKTLENTANSTYVVTDLDSLDIIDKINQKVKGNLSNMTSINPLIKFNNNTYLTDSKTSEQFSLQQLVKERKYGYVSVKMNFQDDAIILPTELLRKIVDNNFKDYIKISYMDNGVFMASNYLEASKVKKTIKVTRGNEEKEDLLNYFKERFLNNDHEVNMSYEMIRDIPYFKNNSFSDMEFTRFENLVIRIIEQTGSDMLAVLDTEGTGLGKAPKCLNIGSLNLEVDKDSGLEVKAVDFHESYFKSLHGSRYLLNEKELSELLQLNKKQVEELSFSDRKLLLVKNSDDSYYMHNPSNTRMKNKFSQILNNYKEDDSGMVMINRRIKSSMYSYLINDTDFKLPQEIVALTGISNRMLNAAGKRTHIVDEEFTKKFEGKNVIFQAHNLPYDLGVIQANMPLLFDKMENSILSDSAIFSRRMKLAYDKSKVANFKQISSIYFYASEHSDMSIVSFLNNAAADESFTGIFPDRTGNFLLKVHNSEVSLINKVSNNEFKLMTKDAPSSPLDLMVEMTIGDLPNTGIKYSVEQLSLHENVRNILLSKEAFNIKKVDIPKSLKHLSKELNYFMENYHFDSTVQENFGNFIEYVSNSNKSIYESKELVEELAVSFLLKNKSIQTKFADAWVYKKVLTLFDPEKGKVTDDIIDLLSYQTDLPKDKVKAVINDAVDYKEKFNLDKVLVHEVHNNIIYDKEGLGDVIIESVLTLKRLADTNYNSYTHDSEYAVKLFLSNALKTTSQHIQRKMKKLADDSYSHKQARGYKRRNKSDFVNQVNIKSVDLIKFKLATDILPPDTSVLGTPKVELSNEEVDDISEKLGFILKNEQLLSSLSGYKDPVAAESLNSILERNIIKCKEYKKEIQDKLETVWFDRTDSKLKKLTTSLFDVCLGQTIDKYNDTFIETDKVIFNDVLDKYEAAFCKVNIPFNRLGAESFIDSLTYLDPFEVKEEVSIKKSVNDLLNPVSDYRDADFLPEVGIKRRNVMHWALKNAPEVIYNTLDKNDAAKKEVKNVKKIERFVLKL